MYEIGGVEMDAVDDEVNDKEEEDREFVGDEVLDELQHVHNTDEPELLPLLILFVAFEGERFFKFSCLLNDLLKEN